MPSLDTKTRTRNYKRIFTYKCEIQIIKIKI